MPVLTRPQKITFGEMRAAAVPRVIRTHGADWQRLRYGIDKPSKMGRPAQRDTEMLFFLLIPWFLFNIFTSSPLLARNRATS
jgi:hypothetical protein